ncbi:hypothetical protein CEXT_435901 [Caerostris extrusa]|uniref:Uncharacterized protein n=1 Tax=Caerostris extrusa TaxID=172846 RepID=A0AAV4UQ09_CAEEX|nr:hypothetical protein CEXT_435901 [Caerostris extrusa]
MSTSEIQVSTGARNPSPMEMSVSPTMMSAGLSKPKSPNEPLTVHSSSNLEINPPAPAPSSIPQEPAPAEYISFAEDYFLDRTMKLYQRKLKRNLSFPSQK